MCERKTDTVRAGFDIATVDLAAALRLAHSEGTTSAAIYRRAVAEYLINHAPADEWRYGWPVGDGIRSQDHGSAPIDPHRQREP